VSDGCDRKRATNYYVPGEKELKRGRETTNMTTIDEINYEFIIRSFIWHCKSINANLLMSRVSVNNQNNAT